MAKLVHAVEFSLLVLCLAPMVPAYGEAPSSQPSSLSESAGREDETPWPAWGGDLRLRIMREVARKLDKETASDDRLWQRYRLRVWTRLSPVKDVDLNVRVMTEPRYYCRQDLPEQFIRQEALFDRLNVRWASAFGLPLAVTIGRQDIQFGDGWLVSEGTPLDGSRTMFFDAARFTYTFKDAATVADLIWVDNHANSSEWIRPFNDRDVDLSEQDERGVILYASNSSLPNTVIDGYFIYKQDRRPRTSAGREGETYTAGAAVSGDIGDRWKYRLELAPQLGHKNGKELRGLASNNRLTYSFKDRMKNTAWLGYEYLSGNDDPDKNYDRLWGRHSRYSDLYGGCIDGIDGRSLDGSNLHRPYVGWSVMPLPYLEVVTTHSLMFADQNTHAGGTKGLSLDGCFRGQLFKLQVGHKLNKHLYHRVVTELFFPGDFYTKDRNDVAMYFEYGIELSW